MEFISIAQQSYILGAFRDLTKICTKISDEHGFNEIDVWLKDNPCKIPNVIREQLILLLKSQRIALMHSELSEGLEGIRKPAPDHHCPEFPSEVVELADAVIRIFHYCGSHSIDLGPAVLAKIAYNNGRPIKHGKEF